LKFSHHELLDMKDCKLPYEKPEPVPATAGS